VTRCIRAGDAAWDPSGAEERTTESAGLRRRSGLSLDPLHWERVARSGRHEPGANRLEF